MNFFELFFVPTSSVSFELLVGHGSVSFLSVEIYPFEMFNQKTIRVTPSKD